MKKKEQKVSFSHFVEKFPELELPLTLTAESASHFSSTNDPFPPAMVRQWLLPFDAEPENEYMEYVPCFRFMETDGFFALVYWKASLLTYEYVLITFTAKGEFIDKKVIGGTKADGDALVQTVASIDEEWGIYIVGGVSSATTGGFDPSESQSFQLELLPTGYISSTN